MAKLDVLYQFDDNYAPFAGVSLTTLFENNQDIEQLTVYLAAKDISEINRERMSRLAEKYNRELIYLNIDQIYQRIEQLGVNGWNGSLATWMKMFVMNDLPESVERLLYLDSDTLIVGSVRELAEINMGDHPVASVIDSISPRSADRLGVSGPYYNAGVILFNLKYWRANNTQNEMLECLKKNISRYPVNDQDLLNDFFRESVLCLPALYNFQGIHFVYKDNVYFSGLHWPKQRYYTEAQIAEAREDIRVIHFFRFCGEYPWQSGNIHPCRSLFEEALNKSYWNDYRYPKKPLKMLYRIERVLYRILPQSLFLRLHLHVSN